MRRIVSVVAIAVLPLVISGCGLFKKKADTTVQSDPYYDPALASQTSQTGYTGYPGGGDSMASGSRTHTVQKKETLFSIARNYYNGDASKWRVIYDANRADIGEDPNRIRVGQKLVIP